MFPEHAAILPFFGCIRDTFPIFSGPDTRIGELSDTCLGSSLAATSADHILNAPFPALILESSALVQVHVMELFGQYSTFNEISICNATSYSLPFN
jgi:hypothetical protein